MKKQSFHILYRVISFLSNITNGFSPFVKYKLVLGTIILGIVAASCNKKGKDTKIENDLQKTDNQPFVETTCYSPSLPIDSNPKSNKSQRKINPKIVIDTFSIETDTEEVRIQCYIAGYDRPQKTHNYEKDTPSVKLYGLIDESPKSPYGELKEFANWVKNNVIYPEELKDSKIGGRVAAKFIIDKNGNLGEITILRSLNPLIDEKVKRVLLSSQAWTGGMHEGKPVKVAVNIVVIFSPEIQR